MTGCSKEQLSTTNQSDLDVSVSSKKGKAVTKSMNGTIVYTTIGSPSSCGCPSSTQPGPLFEGSGNISHLGLSNATVASCAIVSPGVFDFVESCATLVAANGDEIFLDPQPYSLVFDPLCQCFSGNSVVDVIGGTGRFSNATGSFNVFVSQGIDFIVTSNWSGSVTY